MWPPQNGVRLLLVERAQMAFREPTGALSRWRIYIYKCVRGRFRIFRKGCQLLECGFEKAVRGSWKSGRSPTIRRINFKKVANPLPLSQSLTKKCKSSSVFSIGGLRKMASETAKAGIASEFSDTIPVLLHIALQNSLTPTVSLFFCE